MHLLVVLCRGVTTAHIACRWMVLGAIVHNLTSIMAALSVAVLCSGCHALGNVVRGEADIQDDAFLVKPLPEIGSVPEACPKGHLAIERMTFVQIKRCTQAMKVMIDVRWAHYEDSLMSTINTGTTAVDMGVLGLNTIGAFTQDGTTQILSAIATGLGGIKATVNEDLLYKSSITLILQQMKKDRASWATIIQKHLDTTNGYQSMYEAATDLYAYYRAGSWTEALISIQTNAGAQTAQCEAELKNAKMALETKDTKATATATCPTSVPSNATVTPDRVDVSFNSAGSTKLDQTADVQLAALVLKFKTGNYGGITIQGVSDISRDSVAVQMSVADRRAAAVRQSLIDSEVKAADIALLKSIVNGSKREVIVTLVAKDGS